jgi:hypothetical protein
MDFMTRLRNRHDNWRREYKASHEIDSLLENARNTQKYSRVERIGFREKARLEIMSHFGQCLPSSDESDEDGVGPSYIYESDESSDDSSGSEKSDEEQNKRPITVAASNAAAATGKAELERCQILEALLQSIVDNFPFLFALVGFIWRAEGSHYTKSGSTHQLFKDDRYPSYQKIVKEIGPLALQRIQRKQFLAAYYELDIFRKQEEAEASSSMFASSLFDLENEGKEV